MSTSPSSTNAMPASRAGPKRSPNTADEPSAATKGTRSANGATVAAGYRRSRSPQTAYAKTVATSPR